METRETILKELEAISPTVANLSSSNPYVLPSDYFNNLSEVILARAKEDITFETKNIPFNIPAGYFDGLADNILSKIKHCEESVAEELNGIAPLLNTISKDPVYKVPEGYFESLELTIPLKLDKPSAKVFNFGTTKRILQYAVAACTAGILIVGAYFYTNNSSTNNMAISYDSAMNMNVAEELNEVNAQDITAYLEEAPGAGYFINTSSSAEEINIQEYIETASDEEIKMYLDETSGAVNNNSNGS